MSAQPASPAPRRDSAPLPPGACPFCKGAGVVPFHNPGATRDATEIRERCEACDGVGWPGLLYGGPSLPRTRFEVREFVRVYQLHPPRFKIGLLLATPGALSLAREHGIDVLALLRRHRAGDWGAVGRDDALANDLALDAACPARLLSAYDTPGGRLWVVTEADRSATTVLLPSEY